MSSRAVLAPHATGSMASGGVRRIAASPRRWWRVALAPLLLLAAALAGLLFVILLPICGLASIAQGAASAAWDLAREAAPRLPRRHAHRG